MLRSMMLGMTSPWKMMIKIGNMMIINMLTIWMMITLNNPKGYSHDDQDDDQDDDHHGAHHLSILF